jgi:hypothetical protein
MQMRLISKLITTALIAIPVMSMANQQTSITFDNIGKGNDYKLTFGGHSEEVFVGSLLFNTNTSKTEFTSFCVDLDHFISKGETYSVSPGQTGTLSSPNVFKTAGDIFDAGIGTATDANHAAALQIAIWTAIYGNKFSLSGVSSTVSKLEKSYYNNGLKFNGSALMYTETKNCGQSQITTTPEPTSMAVLGIGAFGIFFRRRRK